MLDHERPRPAAPALRVTHRDWSSPLTRPAMANIDDHHERVALTNRWVELDGARVVPVSGEMHYSRVPRAQWEERLRLMRSGGITVIASYVFWIHHEPERGRVDFEDDLDVAAFVALCGELGFDVILRIGPWCHGEVRNGGFPDWVQAASVRHRTDDPAYLELVREWFSRLGEQLAPLCGPGGHVIGIQLENELYDQPGHLLTLKAMARSAGLTAPLWTATAWGGAELPAGEVFPLYGGYADGFWVDADQPWDPTFRAHYLPSHEWDDPGIGADVREAAGTAAAVHRAPVSPDFPIATCELGGGMATAYHRRPVLEAADIAAVANVKLGNGSAWQGYYMYAGGVNPARPDAVDGLQESQATGYPNDLPVFDYDFHAPIGAAGGLSPTHAALRGQHAFLRAFGDRLATMSSSLPELLPQAVTDATTLRWALRSDGDAAFVFLSWHQPYEPLAIAHGVRFSIELDAETIVFPSRPIDVPPGTIARWPVNLDLGALRLRWATASVVTLLDGAHPTLVLQAEHGIPVEYAIGDDVRVIDAVEPEVVVLGPEPDAPRLLILPAAAAEEIWAIEGTDGPQLLRSAAALWLTDDDRVAARSGSSPRVEWFDPGEGAFRPVDLGAQPEGSGPRELSVRQLRPATPDLPPRRSIANRASAPSHSDVLRHGAAYEFSDWRATSPAAAVTGRRRLLEVDWAGDVAVIALGGRVLADRFWDGEPWFVDLDELEAAAGVSGELVIHILPLDGSAAIWLPAAAARSRPSSPQPLARLDRVLLHETVVWEEPARSARIG